MILFKTYIAQQLIGKKLQFKCDCIIPMDVVGIIKNFEISKNEIIFIVDVDGKLIKIGENHPNLYVKST
jgi:hypothetical protein